MIERSPRVTLALMLVAGTCLPVHAPTLAAAAPGERACASRAEDFGAVGDGRADDAASLQRALDHGGVVCLAENTTYRVGAQLRVPPGGGIDGRGSATLVAGAEDFSNRSPLVAARYRQTSAIIDASGMTTMPFTPSHGVTLRGFTLRFQRAEGGYVDGIVARNVNGLLVEDLTLSGFPAGCGIRIATVDGNSAIRNNRIHDFASNTDFSREFPGALPQITAIEVDNDRVGGRASHGLLITGNRISDITVGPVFLAAHGYQTDGINIVHESSSGHVIRANSIRHTGEGIDNFGSRNEIADNRIADSCLFGIKLVHGATGNRVHANTITRSGLAGIVLAGSTVASQDTANNLVSDNAVVGIDPDGAWAAHTTSCFRLTDNHGVSSKVRNNVIARNLCDPGSNGQWQVDRIGSTGENNRFESNRFVRGGTRGTFTVDGSAQR